MKKEISLLFIFLTLSSLADNKNFRDSLLATLPSLKQDSNRINILNQLSYDFRNENPDTAFYFAQQALSLSQKIKYKKGKGDAYHNIGNYFFYHADFPKAKYHYDSALIIREKTGDKKGIANSITNIGRILARQGIYPEAITNYLKALKIYEEIGDKKGIGYNYVYIGVVYIEQQNYPLALDYYSKASDIFEEIGEASGRHRAYSSIGFIYELQKDYSNALEFNYKCLDLYTKDNDKGGVANICSNIGLLKSNLGYFDEAIDFGFKALKISDEIGDKNELINAFNSLGSAFKKKKDFNKAIEYFKQGLTIADNIQSKEDIKNFHFQLSETFVLINDFKSAFEHHQLYSQTKDSLFNEESNKQITEMQTKYETEKKEQQIKLLNKDKEIQDKDLQRQKTIRNAVAGGLLLVLFFSFVLINRLLLIRKQKKLIEIEREKSEKLLLNILPTETADELKRNNAVTPKRFEQVTVMFTDFKGFTTIAEKMSAEELVSQLDFIFKKFDEIISRYPIEKIKTIGDAYMCAGGLPVANSTNPMDVVLAGLEICEFMKSRQEAAAESSEERQLHSSTATANWQIRIGVHTGSVIAGVVGDKKFAYDIWGDTVNVAARMESSGEAGKVNISGTTYNLIKNLLPTTDYKLQTTFRGKIPAKNKGEIEMYFVDRK